MLWTRSTSKGSLVLRTYEGEKLSTFFHSVFFMMGNFDNSAMLYYGFISRTSCFDGVPMILMISISWSIWESPKNGG